MKLRIQDNNVRFRLSRKEVEALSSGKAIEQRTASLPQPLICRIELANISAPDTKFANGVLRVQLPMSEVRRWAGSADVGIEADVPGSDDQSIQLLIEKDFQCLHGSMAGQEDCYPNPQQAGSRDS